jgi:hypothetical protein
VLFIALIAIATKIHLLHLFPWEDEYETIVVARMLAAGGRLYMDVFDQHGPLTFLPGYVLGRFGLASVVAYRLFMLALQFGAIGLALRLAWTLERSAAPLWLGFAAIWGGEFQTQHVVAVRPLRRCQHSTSGSDRRVFI